MPKLEWDTSGKRFYETGVDRVVLYPMDDQGKYSQGYAWSGVTASTKSPSGAEATPLYADNIKYLNLMSAEELAATIEAYGSPEEFDECDGSKELAQGISAGQQTRKKFGLCYRTKLGNDLKGTDYGYKLHLIYNCLASPSEASYATVNDSPEAITFSWSVSTEPVSITKIDGFKPTASLVIDSTKVTKANLDKLEEALYGTATKEAYLPLPDEVITLLGLTGQAAE